MNLKYTVHRFWLVRYTLSCACLHLVIKTRWTCAVMQVHRCAGIMAPKHADGRQRLLN
jgi:hypothetical protein